jgi:hypothetical protein
MRYFPQRARNKTDIGRKLKICTYCLGDMFANGRCVQCQARVTVAPLPDVQALLRQRPPAWPNNA